MTPTQPVMTAALAWAPDIPPRPAVTNTLREEGAGLEEKVVEVAEDG